MNESYSKAKIFRFCGVAFLFGVVFSYFFSFKFIFFLLFGLILFLVINKQKIPLVIIFIVFVFFILGFVRFKFALFKLNYPLKVETLKELKYKIVLVEEKEKYQQLLARLLYLNNYYLGIIYTDLRPVYLKGEIIKAEFSSIEKTTPFYSSGSFVVFKAKSNKIEKIKSSDFVFYLSLFKQKIKNIFDFYIKEPYSNLLASLIFGQKGNLDDSLKEILNSSGLSHLVAVSGLHLLILTKTVSDFLNIFLIKRSFKFLILSLILFFFAFLADFSPSILRALIMAYLLVLVDLNFRIYNPLNSLIFAAFLMVLINPFILIYDFGFELSFLSTLGIILYLPILKKIKIFEKLPHNVFVDNLKESFLVSLSSLITTYPWLIFKIGRFPILSLISNSLVIPFIPYF